MLVDIDFSNDLSYKTFKKNYSPFIFYHDCLINSIKFDLQLGYFSSNAIRVLSAGFSRFIYNGGCARIITNHVLSENDYELLIQNKNYDKLYYKSLVEEDYEGLYKILLNGEVHFFNCLNYLLKTDRLIIQPIILKNKRIAHYKEGLFEDSSGNKVHFNGSSNFTAGGVIHNGESLVAARSWGSVEEENRVNNFCLDYDKMISKSDDSFEYLNPEHIHVVIRGQSQDKNEEDLLSDGQDLINSIDTKSSNLQEAIRNIKIEQNRFLRDDLKLPSFPFDEPRLYQLEARDAWIQNGKTGIFAMATGTGKTITSLNCLLEEYRSSKTKKYHCLILVPGQTLLEQWDKEVGKFNFSKNVIKASSKYKWVKILARLLSRLKRVDQDFIVISTYDTFRAEKFQKLIHEFPEDTLLIADEAHNIGAEKTLEAFNQLKFKKRIALSATPKRVYDEIGTHKIEQIFSDNEPYTYNFSMGRAIDERHLSKYFYYPHVVKMSEEEFARYRDLSKKISKSYAIDPDVKTNHALNALYNQRKRIIHQCHSKFDKAKEILTKKFRDQGNLKYSFVYVPEGKSSEDELEYLPTDEEKKIIDEYVFMIGSISPDILVNRIVSGITNRDEILSQFRDGKIDVLASMKCLDEGVDVPEAKFALFCSSTGNPRQFIQRRGRVLRKYPNKIAEIHDLMVIPDKFTLDEQIIRSEQSILQGELKRVLYFSSLSLNKEYTFDLLEDYCKLYEINMYQIYNELKQ